MPAEPTGKQKTALRGQKWWKELRASKIAEVRARDPEGKLRCEITGVWIKNESSAQCHHRFPDRYQSEDLDDYRILSASSHDFIEWLSTIKKDTFPRYDLMMAWLGEFITVKERTVDKYYAELRESVDKTPQ
jgi:hypothetical protein